MADATLRLSREVLFPFAEKVGLELNILGRVVLKSILEAF